MLRAGKCVLVFLKNEKKNCLISACATYIRYKKIPNCAACNDECPNGGKFYKVKNKKQLLCLDCKRDHAVPTDMTERY